jgi:hypothetical protein
MFYNCNFASVRTRGETVISSKQMDFQDEAVPIRFWERDRPPDKYSLLQKGL